MSTRGIDYSGPAGTCNRDPDTGIRYGIISAHALADWLWDEVEDVYHPHCPSCGGDLPEETIDALDEDSQPCPMCEETIEAREDVYGDEPSERIIQTSEGIKGFIDSSMDVWIVESPYYTRASFCSPCALGAVSLGSPCEDGERGYCLPHPWYRDGEAPHPVFRLADDRRVFIRPERFSLFLDLRNEAFQGDPSQYGGDWPKRNKAIIRCLESVIARLKDGSLADPGDVSMVRDPNGNTIGHASFPEVAEGEAR